MAMTVTKVDPNDGIIKRGKYIDILFTAAGAKTFLQNTILALDSVSLKAVVYEKGGSTNENGIPKFILTYPVTTTGAGDVRVRAMLTGELVTERCVIDADGDASNIDNAVKSLCKDQGIVLVDAHDYYVADNQ